MLIDRVQGFCSKNWN